MHNNKSLQLSFLALCVLAPLAYGEASFWQMLGDIDPQQAKSIAANHLGLTLALCFVSGILTSLTPCVYPMIPITINIFGRASQAGPTSGAFNGRVFGLAVIYVGGMCLTYSILGLVSGLTGSLFGSLMQSSWMLGFMSLLFLVLALGQLGLFKLALPASLQTKFASAGNTTSPVGIFVMGIFSGLIISPCVGPVVAGILAFVFESSNAWMGTLYFFSFSLGLGVLFLVIGGFSGVLSKLPRSGSWMTRINRVLAVLLIVAAGYYGLLWMRKLGWVDRGIPVAGSVDSVQWLTDEKAALLLQKEKQLPIILDFTAEWCAACHEIEHQVFSQPEAQKALSGFIPLRIDVTEENAENEALLKRYGVFSLPTVLFIDPSGTPQTQPRIHGVLPVEKFLALLKEVRKS